MCLQGRVEESSVEGEGWTGERGEASGERAVCVRVHAQDYDNKLGK